jgi:5-formyltetrahydrofolate cyclo-ligase
MNKNIFRKHCLKELKKQKNHSSFLIDKKIQKKLYKRIEESNAKTVMLYLPMDIEVDIMPLIVKLRREKRTIFVPFMEGESFRLVKYRMPLERKKFGIKEPKYSKQYKPRGIDIAIVPIVGSDPSKRRIGFGKGMYDRFFEREGKNIKKTLFVTRVLCLSSQVITDDYDIKADEIITAYKSIKSI